MSTICDREGLHLHDRNFSVRYETNVPQQVGLAGSSAIIVATLRCLMEFYDIEIPLHVQPSLVLSVETEELGHHRRPAGSSDPVLSRVWSTWTLAWKKKQTISGLKCYAYEPLTPLVMPSFYIAYHAEFSEPTEIFHNDIRSRFDRGESQIVEAMQRLPALLKKDVRHCWTAIRIALFQLITTTMTCAASIYNLSPWQAEMVETARECGASAKFAGSGGAIVGIYRGEEMLEEMRQRLGALGSNVIVPQIDGD